MEKIILTGDRPTGRLHVGVFAGTGIKNRRRKLRRQRELDVYFQDHKDEIIKK